MYVVKNVYAVDESSEPRGMVNEVRYGEVYYAATQYSSCRFPTNYFVFLMSGNAFS